MDGLYLKELTDGDIELVSHWLEKEYIKKWFQRPQHWLNEIKERDGEFSFINHFIAYFQNAAIGFCQYYDCAYAKEDWYEAVNPGDTYSIDYLIGEECYLEKGLGTGIIKLLCAAVKRRGASRIVVKPEKENIRSGKALLSAGFVIDRERDYYFKYLR